VEALLGVEPAVMLVAPMEGPFTSQPPAIASAPAEEALASEWVGSAVGTPRATGANSSAEVASPLALLLHSEVKQEPDEVVVVPDSPETERFPSPAPSADYRRAYRQLRCQILSKFTTTQVLGGYREGLGRRVLSPTHHRGTDSPSEIS